MDQKKLDALSKYNEVLGSITLAEEFSNLFTFLLLEVSPTLHQAYFNYTVGCCLSELIKTRCGSDK